MTDGSSTSSDKRLSFDADRLRWRTSSASAGGNCVTVGKHGDRIALRNSKDPQGGTLFFTRSEMAAWIAGVKAGEFDDLIS